MARPVPRPALHLIAQHGPAHPAVTADAAGVSEALAGDKARHHAPHHRAHRLPLVHLLPRIASPSHRLLSSAARCGRGATMGHNLGETK